MAKPAAGCLFCSIIHGEGPAAIVHETPQTVAFLDTRPLFHGHVLLCPREHVQTLSDLPLELIQPLFEQAQRLARAVQAAMGAEGTFVAMNNRVSQSVPHLHVHIVPRRKGDGLKGFFWPRTRYDSAGQMREVAARIAGALKTPAPRRKSS